MSKKLERKIDKLEKQNLFPGIDISGLAEGEEDEELKLHIQSRVKLYERATATGDDRTALRALQDIAKLQLLYPNDRDNADKNPDMSQYLKALGIAAEEVWADE